MKQLLHNLFLPLFAAALCSGACSDADHDRRPTPSPYDIYTAGYKTPSGKSVATVWKNGSELYALTDGTNDAWAYSVFVDNGTVYAAGYEQQGDAIVGKIWVNGALKYTVAPASGSAYLYSISAADGSLYVAGSEDENGALTAKIWKDGAEAYAYSVSPAVSQAKAVAVSGSDVYAAGSLRSGLGKQLAVVWKNDKAHFTLSDGQTDAGATALCRDGRTLYTAGYAGTQAVVGKDGSVLYTLTDGSSSAQATAVCRSGSALYAAGYVIDGFENEGVVWKNGRELYDLSDGSGEGSMPYAIAVYGDDVFSAGTLFAHRRGVARREDPPYAHRRHGTRRSLLDVRRTALRLTRRIGNGKGHGLSGSCPFLCAIPRPEE